MKRIQIVKPYIKTQSLEQNIFAGMDENMKLVALYGVEVEVLIDEPGEHLVLRTKHPVSILLHPNGSVVDVLQGKA